MSRFVARRKIEKFKDEEPSLAANEFRRVFRLIVNVVFDFIVSESTAASSSCDDTFTSKSVEEESLHIFTIGL